MESIKEILDSATAQGADQETLWKFGTMHLVKKAFELVVDCQESTLQLTKCIVKLQERIDALEGDYDELAESFQDLEYAVTQDKAI